MSGEISEIRGCRAQGKGIFIYISAPSLLQYLRLYYVQNIHHPYFQLPYSSCINSHHTPWSLTRRVINATTSRNSSQPSWSLTTMLYSLRPDHTTRIATPLSSLPPSSSTCTWSSYINVNLRAALEAGFHVFTKTLVLIWAYLHHNSIF